MVLPHSHLLTVPSKQSEIILRNILHKSSSLYSSSSLSHSLARRHVYRALHHFAALYCVLCLKATRRERPQARGTRRQNLVFPRRAIFSPSLSAVNLCPILLARRYRCGDSHDNREELDPLGESPPAPPPPPRWSADPPGRAGCRISVSFPARVHFRELPPREEMINNEAIIALFNFLNYSSITPGAVHRPSSGLCIIMLPVLTHFFLTSKRPQIHRNTLTSGDPSK